MIQDIQPHRFHNEFKIKEPKDTDVIFLFDGRRIMASQTPAFHVPFYSMVKGPARYLFQIDGTNFFLGQTQEVAGFEWIDIHVLRQADPKPLCFAAITAYHLYTWYSKNRYCGCCGEKMEHSKIERAMVCPSCGNIVYPTIAPAVIVGVIHHDAILMTRYAGRRYKGHALIAGFCEIGETAEDTVRREVMEEVGLKVKNIRYYKSQPWGFDSNILMGYFADLDGGTNITLEEDELAKARFIPRSEIDDAPDHLSLTREMILAFKNGQEI
ncbi:NAD(+) diphosphatase [Catenisphaera adipataccumulans]|jgi:NAD+ diphosphatase|uniref:NAD(+) diphosphatase n=1 Tax=Catenisphaera adipataccumulans TaxID=700500 RepID=A0A7W8FVS2_9FIRM|nr:NAD(+) diphosphatase [Catenisphaera adipataccumulans]MBB5183458.1 NAD+ diphosphatase [Catenisphaera adipataccumulans]